MSSNNYNPINVVFLLILGVFLGKYFILDSDKSDSKIDSIIRLIEENYVDGFDVNDFEEEILTGIMNQLDPHSNYIPKSDQVYSAESMQGSFSGVGIEFNIIKDTLVVVSAISGGPSEKLGIISSDRIVEVDGEEITSVGLTNVQVVEKLRGKKGSIVEIKINRRGENELLIFNIIRGDIPIYSVDASFMLKNNIGYVKVNRFSATTNQEFQESTNELLTKGMTKLILDLRGNPGGYLGSAIYMCNEFLSEGDLIVYTEGKYRGKEEIFSDNNGNLKNVKLVVLINQGSASASEIVAGCMQDLDRATIVGNRSFGKGLVQEEIRLSDGSAVRLTTSRYYIPSGRSIQKPYGGNVKDYHSTQLNGSKLEIKDSILYKTKNGRIVFGGGGITPDSIISSDSSLNYIKFNKLRRNNFIIEFALSEQKNIDLRLGIDSIDEEKLYEKFKLYIKRRNPDFDLNMGSVEKSDLKNYIKATIVKNLLDNDEYFRVLSEDDKYIIKALDILN